MEDADSGKQLNIKQGHRKKKVISSYQNVTNSYAVIMKIPDSLGNYRIS